MATERTWDRRTVLGMGATALAASVTPNEAQQVPWSTGTTPAKTKAPPNATDCHHHIYSTRFKVDPKSTLRPGDASVDDYRLLQKRIGTSRNVIVQPSTYGVFNDGLVEALGECGPTARGIAVVNDTVTDAELKQLDAARVRGIRFNLATPGGATSMAMLEPLAKRIAPMGWHVQFNMTAAMLLDAKDVLNRLPCQIVFDHLAHIPEPAGPAHPSFGAVVDLLQKGKAWIKLSGAYQDTKIGPPTYADSTAVAQAYVKAAPERLVWGSDWPHPSEKDDNKPDDAVLFDLLAQWAPDEAVRNRILVDNPARLYGFASFCTGLGLFATTPIAKGMPIVEYRGRRLPTREAHEREQQTGSKYMFELNGRWSIDGSSRRNLARYVNHACRPNAEFVLMKGKLMLRADKAMVPGDEITCDYGHDYFDLFIAPVGCRCSTCAATR